MNHEKITNSFAITTSEILTPLPLYLDQYYQSPPSKQILTNSIPYQTSKKIIINPQNPHHQNQQTYLINPHLTPPPIPPSNQKIIPNIDSHFVTIIILIQLIFILLFFIIFYNQKQRQQQQIPNTHQPQLQPPPMLETQHNWSQLLISRVSNQKNSPLPKYQLLLFINFSIKWFLAGMILFSLNFFYITPEFECKDGEVPIGKKCEEYVCSLNENQWYEHLIQPIPKSIALDYGILMLCSNKWLSSLLQSLFYLGSFIGYLLMPFLAQKFGQKLTERASWIITIIGFIFLVSSINLEMVGIANFFIGLGTNSAITLHYIFLKLFMVGKMKQRSYLILQVMFSIGVSSVALSSMFIPNWKIVAGAFMLAPCILLLPFSIWIIEQIPNYSLKCGKIVLLNSLNKIAKINSEDELGMEDLEFIPNTTIPINENKKISNQYSLTDLFRYKSLRYMAIVCPAMDLIIEFIYDGTILSLDKLGISVYLNQILVGFVQIFSSIFSSWIVIKIKRKKFIQLCLFLTIFFTIVIGILTLLFQHKNNQINTHVIFQMLTLACLRFVLNSMWGLFFVYIAELFPSNVLSLTFGLVSASGTVGAFSSPFIRLLTADATMFFMAFLCICALFFMRALKQTKGQKAMEQIQQRMNQQIIKKSTISQKDI